MEIEVWSGTVSVSTVGIRTGGSLIEDIVKVGFPSLIATALICILYIDKNVIL
jgi:hypothetical protein